MVAEEELSAKQQSSVTRCFNSSTTLFDSNIKLMITVQQYDNVGFNHYYLQHTTTSIAVNVEITDKMMTPIAYYFILLTIN